MTMLDDFEVLPVAATLQTDGAVLLEVHVTGTEEPTKVTMPAGPYSRQLAREIPLTLDLDELVNVSPQLAGEIDFFCGQVRDRLIARAARA